MIASLAQRGPIIKPFASGLPCVSRSTLSRDYSAQAVQSRRLVLGQIVASIVLFPHRTPALEVALLSEAPPPPKSYVSFARKLLSALRDSMEAELSPANETEVRRKAEPAKKLVKEWVSTWRDTRSVTSETSYRRITESLQILGDFYLKKGQRARLPQELGSRILRLLDEASAALPA